MDAADVQPVSQPVHDVHAQRGCTLRTAGSGCGQRTGECSGPDRSGEGPKNKLII